MFRMKLAREDWFVSVNDAFVGRVVCVGEKREPLLGQRTNINGKPGGDERGQDSLRP